MKNEFKMSWYNFYTYIRFPFIIVSSVLTICYTFQTFDFLLMLVSLLMLLLMVITFILLVIKHKDGYYLNVFWLCLETYVLSVQTISPHKNISLYLLSLALSMFLWFLPNFVYFNKRKAIFNIHTKKHTSVSTFSEFKDALYKNINSDISMNVCIPYILLTIAIACICIITYTLV